MAKKKIKNKLDFDNGYLVKYNFGIRKPVQNVCELISEQHPWNDFLIDKWVYFRDQMEERNIYFKHIYLNQRIYQIVYSGLDVLGDGVYILYKANIEYSGHEKEHFLVVPDEFAMIIASFEHKDFLKTIFDEKYITQEEYEIFKDKKKRDNFAKDYKLFEMVDSGIKD